MPDSRSLPKVRDLESVIGQQTHGIWHRITAQQAFWVFLAALLAALTPALTTDSFATPQNIFNVTRNFAFVANVALGMTVVIISGCIDLSVGSVLCLSAMVLVIFLNDG